MSLSVSRNSSLRSLSAIGVLHCWRLTIANRAEWFLWGCWLHSAAGSPQDQSTQCRDLPSSSFEAWLGNLAIAARRHSARLFPRLRRLARRVTAPVDAAHVLGALL